MINQKSVKEFLQFAFMVIIFHTITYFIFGAVMSNIFDYASLFQTDVVKDFMQPINSENILYGPFFQPLRGFLFALAIYPLRKLLADNKRGWLILWGIFLIFGIISTPGPAPCSIEGIIYTKLPLWFHLIGIWEIALQTLFFSFILVRWLKGTTGAGDKRVLSDRKIIFKRFMLALSIACFGYVGYAIGGILTAYLAGKSVDLKSASTNFSAQFPILFSFFINLTIILFVTSKKYFSKISLLKLFLFFWTADTLSPLVYQLIFSYMMPLHLAVFMGFFPALIIAGSFKMNEKNYADLIKQV